MLHCLAHHHHLRRVYFLYQNSVVLLSAVSSVKGRLTAGTFGSHTILRSLREHAAHYTPHTATPHRTGCGWASLAYSISFRMYPSSGKHPRRTSLFKAAWDAADKPRRTNRYAFRYLSWDLRVRSNQRITSEHGELNSSSTWPSRGSIEQTRFRGKSSLKDDLCVYGRMTNASSSELPVYATIFCRADGHI